MKQRLPPQTAAVDVHVTKEFVEGGILLIHPSSIHWTDCWGVPLLGGELCQNLFHWCTEDRMWTNLDNHVEALLCQICKASS